MRLNLPIRARLTLLYLAVLTLSFLAFFWISDLGFRHSIDTTVNEASRTNLQTIERLLASAGPHGAEYVRSELRELANLWANGALLEVADANGSWLYRSSPFLHASPTMAQPSELGIVFFTTNLDSLQYRVALERVETGACIFEIHAAVPTEPFDQALDRFRAIEKGALPLLVVLASILGYWLSGKSMSPVNRIIETADLIGGQNLSRRLEVPKPQDELQRLTLTLNAMLDRIETSFRKITQFTADASHDLRTPITVIRTAAEIALRRSRADSEYREALARILATSIETSELLEKLLTLARADAGAVGMEMYPLDLNRHIRKVREHAALLSAEKALNIDVQTPSLPVWVVADAIAIDRLLLILVDNAIKYTPNGGRCDILLSQSNGTAQITVRDSGVGIAQDDLPNIFDRFYRADRVRSRGTYGAGLGLAIARWIIDMHGGKIAVESAPGAGSVFRVSLPAYSGQVSIGSLPV